MGSDGASEGAGAKHLGVARFTCHLCLPPHCGDPLRPPGGITQGLIRRQKPYQILKILDKRMNTKIRELAPSLTRHQGRPGPWEQPAQDAATPQKWGDRGWRYSSLKSGKRGPPELRTGSRVAGTGVTEFGAGGSSGVGAPSC